MGFGRYGAGSGMKSQRGQLSPTLIIALIGAAVVIGSIGYGKLQSSRLDACRASAAAFEAQVKANADAAFKAKQAQEAKDKVTKERIDNETKTLRASNASLARQLRDARSAGGFLPKPSPSAGSAETITFNRARLESALQHLDDGVSAIVERGAGATADLDLALKWASDIQR